ncbi:hypothetical protein ACIQK9_34940 [Streptomyces hydrogenans]|uniref:hypothetical protein n=1 Tax=Streptomyces hydrogenans TaxID=1873719 RepID=UPI003806F830
MTPHFTDRDERLWQRHAEERPARPLPVGAWLRTLRATLRTHRPASRTTEGATWAPTARRRAGSSSA